MGARDGDEAVRQDDRAPVGWCELLAEAIGTRPNQVDQSWETLLDVRVQAMLAALAAARLELGRWPTAVEWDRGGRRPSARTFVCHLGGWAGACRAAAQGWASPTT